jgi:hypothetical protein
MKPIADWIRDVTPGWTDGQRYRWLGWAHTALEPFFLIGITTPSLQFVVFTLQLFTVFSQFFLRECLLTLLESEFAESPSTDLFASLLSSLGWTITRSEKITFNLGFNCGLLLLTALILLQRSLVWSVWILASLAIASLALALLAKVPRRPGTAPQPAGQTPSPPALP